MSTPARAARTGAIAALLFAVAVGAFVYFSAVRSGSLAKVDRLDRVVVVFAAHGEDGTQLARVVALVTNEGRDVRFVDPETTASIAGTSYNRLEDAYAFGGGRAVATALGEGGGGPVAFVDVPEQVWEAVLKTPGGVSVNLPKPLDVFDGKRLVNLPEGTSTVPPEDVALLLQGVASLPAAGRSPVREGVWRASMAALGRSPEAKKAATDLTDEAFATLLSRLEAR